MSQNYYQKEIETMPREEMKKLQSEKLVKQVKHVYENVPYYRDLMDKKGVKPEDIHGIDDLHKLPFLTKADLRDAYPYGLLAKPLDECVRIQSTSGTTGHSFILRSSSEHSAQSFKCSSTIFTDFSLQTLSAYKGNKSFIISQSNLFIKVT
mgnify:CR=1 FL=1